ncbi:MAG: hypothetical protein U9R75_04890 [Candidatus Thermoplasmatota archaeon]|nr:hypothetical protein [Candidatus Thermoplasmatota archaeon]
MGISPTILIMSMILVSSTTGGLLVTNINEIQEKAEDVLSGVMNELSCGFTIISIHAHATDEPYIVDSIHLKLRPGPGSDPVDLDELVIEISTKDDLIDVTMNSTDGSYSYEEILDDDMSMNSGIMNEGDLFKLIIRLGPISANIRSDYHLDMSIVPKNGGSTRIGVVFPEPLYSEWTRLK